MSEILFHLAIPCHDLEEARSFYQKLGVKIGRAAKDNFILDFWGHQVVCHLSPESKIENPTMYPRHYGLVFKTQKMFNALYEECQKNLTNEFFKPKFTRFGGALAEHTSFFIKDPSGNLIEFKFYKHEESIFN